MNIYSTLEVKVNFLQLTQSTFDCVCKKNKEHNCCRKSLTHVLNLIFQAVSLNNLYVKKSEFNFKLQWMKMYLMMMMKMYILVMNY